MQSYPRHITIKAKRKVETDKVIVKQDQIVSCRVCDTKGSYELRFPQRDNSVRSIKYGSYKEACEDFDIQDWYYDEKGE